MKFHSQKFQGCPEVRGKISIVKKPLHFYHVAFVISILHSWGWGCNLVIEPMLSVHKAPSSTSRTPKEVNK